MQPELSRTRDLRCDTDKCIDHRGKMRLQNWPQPLEARARVFVEPVSLEAGGQFGVHFVLGHQPIPVVHAK